MKFSSNLALLKEQRKSAALRKSLCAPRDPRNKLEKGARNK